MQAVMAHISAVVGVVSWLVVAVYLLIKGVFSDLSLTTLRIFVLLGIARMHDYVAPCIIAISP